MKRQPEPLSLGHLRDPRELTHGLFRFPGRFHPPLVTYLIQKHPESRIIGDPMTGCGTAAIETVFAGKAGLFSDIDPLACLLTRAKARPVDPDWLVNAISSIIEQSKPFAKPGVKRAKALKYIWDLEGSTSFRAPPHVFHWFKPYVAVNICKVLQSTARLEVSGRRKDSLLATFASVVRKLSRADPQTSSGLEVTRVRREALASGLKFDVAKELTKKGALLARGYRELRERPLGKVKVVNADARKWSEVCSRLNIWPDLVVTSPCYMSAIEYWRRHKLEYFWLGLVNEESLLHKLQHKFLGMGLDDPELDSLTRYARRMYLHLKRSGYEREATRLARYFNDTAAWIREIATVIDRSKGTAYVVVGSNSHRGHHIDTPSAIQEIAESEGLSSQVYMRYLITNYHMQYPTKGPRITNETVLTLRKLN